MITKVSAPNSVPTDISDYVAQNAHLMAFMNQVNMQAFVLTNPTTLDKPKIALGSYISHGGSLYKVETSDEDITGSPADGKVYVRVTGDATLTASFIADISGYTYNHAYGALTSGSYTLLPYELRKSGNDWLKYRYDAVQQMQTGDIVLNNIGLRYLDISAGDVLWYSSPAISTSSTTYVLWGSFYMKDKVFFGVVDDNEREVRIMSFAGTTPAQSQVLIEKNDSFLHEFSMTAGIGTESIDVFLKPSDKISIKTRSQSGSPSAKTVSIRTNRGRTPTEIVFMEN